MTRFTNQAQLRYGNTVANSNVAAGEILEVLSATKTAVRTVYGPDDNVTFLISILNAGDTAVTGLTLSDNLGSYTFGTSTLTPLEYIDNTVQYYVNGVLQTKPTAVAGPPLTITGLSVPAGGNATIVYETELNQYAPQASGSTITNDVTISGTGITPITADATVTAESGAILGITKSVSPVPVTENGTLTYTFLIQNTGNTEATATTGAVVTDTFLPILSNLTATFNGTTWTEGTNYTYDETTGEFATVDGQITVPAATWTQDSTSGAWVVSPGVSTLVVTGTV